MAPGVGDGGSKDDEESSEPIKLKSLLQKRMYESFGREELVKG